MPNPEISLAISSTCFGLVIGFFAGYGTRAYMSYLRRRATAASPPAGRCDGAGGVFATARLQLERVRAAQARGTRVEVWFQDEARIGQKNTLTQVWGQTASRPAAPKDLGFVSAYVFGAVCPSEGKAAALIMPICNTAAMNHHLCEMAD